MRGTRFESFDWILFQQETRRTRFPYGENSTTTWFDKVNKTNYTSTPLLHRGSKKIGRWMNSCVEKNVLGTPEFTVQPGAKAW